MKKLTPRNQNYSFSLILSKLLNFMIFFGGEGDFQCFRVANIPALHLAIRLALSNEVPFKVLQETLAPINRR